MKWLAERACCNLSLRDGCIGIAAFYIFTLILNVFFRSSFFAHSTSFIGFVIEVIANAALFVGALRENAWLVLVWLIGALLFFIGWPIAVLGVIFNYGPYREISSSDNIFLILLEYVLILVIFLFFTRVVVSYFKQLREDQTKFPHTVHI